MTKLCYIHVNMTENDCSRVIESQDVDWHAN